LAKYYKEGGKMSKKALRILLITFLTVCISSLGLAQRTTQTGTLNGTVHDDQAIALPGVTVTVSSPALILPQVSTVTDTKGFFRIPQLPVGFYKVVFELTGFKTIIRDGLKISMGMTSTLNIITEQSTIEETIMVIGKGPTVDKQNTSLGVIIDRNILESIPAARDYQAVFEMAPGVTLAGGWATSHGSSVMDNSWNVDGVSITDPVSGLFGSIQLGYEVAEEYQIQTGGHSAEYGNVRGTMLNLITKSGGNKLSGEANFFLRHNKFQSDNTQGTPFEGTFLGYNYDFDTTLQLGGPIVKDKLWFFASYTHEYRETFVEGYPYDKEEHVPTDYRKQFPFMKLSFQLNPRMKLVGGLAVWIGGRNHRDADRFRNEDVTRKGDFISFTPNLAYSFQISNNLIFTAKFALAFVDWNYVPKNDLPRYYSYDTRLYSGSAGYYYYVTRNRVQFLTDATYFADDFLGRHEFKSGVEYEFAWDVYENQFNKDPNNGLGYRLQTYRGAPYRARDYEDFRRIDHKFRYGVYIQDRWNPIDRLTFNLGLRFDRQDAVVPRQAQDRTPVLYGGVTYDPRVLESFKVWTWNTLSPRLGASYDLTGDGKTIIKASFGRYFLSGDIQFFSIANPNGNVIRYYYLNSDWSINRQYDFWAAAATQIDSNLKAPYLDEILVGIQREIIPDLSLSVNYIRKWDHRLMEGATLEALDVDAIKGGEYIWSNYTPVTAVDPYDGQTVTFYDQSASLTTQTTYITNPEPAKRDYEGVEVLLNKRFSHNWQLMASYVYSKSTGLIGLSFDEADSTSSLFGDPNTHINAVGRFPDERRHQFKVQGTYRAPLGIAISTYYRGFAGRRYTRYIRSSDLGLSLYQGSVGIYAEDRGSRGLPWLHLWDIRLEKRFRISQFNLGVVADIFNVFNVNTTTSVETLSSSGATFGAVTGITDPRIIRLGIRLSW